ncbi:MAG: hypothetical protein J7L62_06090 [Candidatus Aminicenantes bacterium]|nr:hypothetical protein [Candidatus Aminicenantes bacterium]
MRILILEYEIRDKEGRILGASKFEGPMKVRIGSGELWKELEDKLKGLKTGDEKSFWINVPFDKSKIKKVSKKSIPPDVKAGEQFYVETPAGVWSARLLGYEGEDAVIDLNPPYAGDEVFYKIKVLYEEELS